MKGHTNARDCRRTRLVQQTRNYKPLVTLVNKMARQMLPEWFTWTTMQLSCNVLTNRISMCMTRPLGRQCFPPASTRGDNYGCRWVVYLMVQVDGDVVCSAWMVLHGMAPRAMYASNRFSYVRVHGMAIVLGTGRGGCWCCTPVVTGGHSRRGTAHSSMRPHSAYMQVHSGPVGGAPRRPWGTENPYGYNWCWLGTTMQSLLVASGGHGGQHASCLDEEGV